MIFFLSSPSQLPATESDDLRDRCPCQRARTQRDAFVRLAIETCIKLAFFPEQNHTNKDEFVADSELKALFCKAL